jgi:probable phosphoglycerate mutase
VTSGSVWLVRHGETDWSRRRLHTSVTDVPLTEWGMEAGREIGTKLAGRSFSLVLTSPRLRARLTAQLAGFPDALPDDDLAEWAYGDYEGISTEEIRRSVPAWTIWSHSAPGGETPADVRERVDRVIARVRTVEGDSLLFGHAHSLRALAARWLGQEVVDGRLYRLDTGTLSALGYERETPVIERWNS